LIIYGIKNIMILAKRVRKVSCSKTCGFITEKTAEVRKQAEKYAKTLKKNMEEA